MDVLKGNYWYIPNFLSKEEFRLFNLYTQLFHTWNLENFDDKQTNLGETYHPNDGIFESLLMIKTKKVEEVVGRKLFPTYSFWRFYNKFSTLDKHKDRHSCEVTASVNLGGCGTEWPLYIDGQAVNIKPGDAAVYHGMELEHWREEFQGDGQAQVFFHWVYQDGDYKDYKFDKRPSLGAPWEQSKPIKNNV